MRGEFRLPNVGSEAITTSTLAISTFLFPCSISTI